VISETRTTRRGIVRTVYRVDAAIAARLAKECVYVEQGKSGAVGRSRPLFDRMKRDAGQRRFTRLLVWKVSRLGRDMREVIGTVLATSFTRTELTRLFKNNVHVMHGDVFKDQKDRLVLVKGNANSRLLKQAIKISSIGMDRNGRPLHRLAPDMQRLFGDFHGHTSIQRCPPRWVTPDFTRQAAEFILSLR